MRTTVSLDDDVAALLNRRMAERRLSFKQAINEALREALLHAERVPFETPVFDLGEPLVSLDKALHLAAALDDEDALRAMTSGD